MDPKPLTLTLSPDYRGEGTVEAALQDYRGAGTAEERERLQKRLETYELFFGN